MLRMSRVVIVHADKLQSIDFDFLFIQNTDAGFCHSTQVSGGIGESLVIPQYEVLPERRRYRSPRFSEAVQIGRRSVIHVSGDEDDIGLESADHAHNPANESDVSHVP